MSNFNSQPVIGIISRALGDEAFSFGNIEYDYIMASYVSWLEDAGALVVPLIAKEGYEVAEEKL